MVQRLFLIVLSASLLTSCACAKKAATTKSNSTVDAPTKTPAAATKDEATPDAVTQKVEPANPCQGVRTKYKGNVTLKGEIGSTKGAQLTLRGVILRLENRRESQHWRGKNVMATGDLCIYNCGLVEQCLIECKISYLKNVKLTELPPNP